ncbi:MAG: hypothetical protein WAQ28_12995 [Bacteroidia bacterium]
MYKYIKKNDSEQKGNLLLKVPPTINFFRLLNEYELKRELKHIPKYEYFISLIYPKQIERVTYVPVSNAILKKVIRQPIIKRMKENLFTMGVVECDYKMKFELQNAKTVGLEPYGYRITSKYYIPHTTNGTTTTSTGTNAIVYNRDGSDTETGKTTSTHNNKPTIYNRYGFTEEKVNKSRDAFYNKVAEAHYNRWNDLIDLPQKPEYKFIQENTTKLEIDTSVYDWIDKQVLAQLPLKPRQCQFVNPNGKLVVYIQKNRVLNKELAEGWKQHIQKMQNGVFHFSCPPTVNRVFYNVTAMPSELRKFLRYEGKSLAHLDYSNFQPFLFIKYLVEKYKDHLPEDVMNYIDITSRGVFYAEVMALIKEKGIAIKNESNFKYDFFKRVFFSKAQRNDKYRTAFADKFPNVYAVIADVKSGNYKTLSIELQKLEARIVINTILNEIAQKYPTSFVLPIHDALICEQEMSEIVKQLMIEKTKQIIGFEPKMKQELLIPTI